MKIPQKIQLAVLPILGQTWRYMAALSVFFSIPRVTVVNTVTGIGAGGSETRIPLVTRYISFLQIVHTSYSMSTGIVARREDIRA